MPDNIDAHIRRFENKRRNVIDHEFRRDFVLSWNLVSQSLVASAILFPEYVPAVSIPAGIVTSGLAAFGGALHFYEKSHKRLQEHVDALKMISKDFGGTYLSSKSQDYTTE